MSASTAATAVADAHRREWAYVFAAVVRVTRDFDLAEDCVQDAYAQALRLWPGQGVPKSPAAWLTTTARNRALDQLRHRAVERRTIPLLVIEQDASSNPDQDDDVGDERLRLIFTCCHPALSPEARIALTLRLLCGMSTAQIARSFLVSEATMAARITRAKKKIARARIPYRVPALTELAARTNAVLEVVHLLFTAGHTAPNGRTLLRPELSERAIELARVLRALLPSNREVAGLLALVLLTDARRGERLSLDGRLKPLADQDRSRWDGALIAEGTVLVREALSGRPPGKYALMAGIAALHDEAPSWEVTDWPQIVGFYDLLVRAWPTPVVALNRAVAIRFADGPIEGLAALEILRDEPQLLGYPYFSVARAECLHTIGRNAEAQTAYEEAILLTENDVERAFLSERLREVGS